MDSHVRRARGRRRSARTALVDRRPRTTRRRRDSLVQSMLGGSVIRAETQRCSVFPLAGSRRGGNRVRRATSVAAAPRRRCTSADDRQPTRSLAHDSSVLCRTSAWGSHSRERSSSAWRARPSHRAVASSIRRCHPRGATARGRRRGASTCLSAHSRCALRGARRCRHSGEHPARRLAFWQRLRRWRRVAHPRLG